MSFWLAQLPETRVSLISSAERPIKCTDSLYLGLDEQHIAFTQCEGPGVQDFVNRSKTVAQIIQAWCGEGARCVGSARKIAAFGILVDLHESMPYTARCESDVDRFL